MNKSDIGLVGLAVMGQNLVLNMERNGYRVAVYNRTTQTMRDFVAEHPGKELVGCDTPEQLVAALERPRKVMLMVKAGAPVDTVIDQLKPLLEPGDLLIDGGNSTTKTLNDARWLWRRQVCATSALGSAAASRERCGGRRSCPAGNLRRGKWSSRSLRQSLPRWAVSRV